MKPINIEKLMGHSIGISGSYYRATENELLEDYVDYFLHIEVCFTDHYSESYKSCN